MAWRAVTDTPWKLSEAQLPRRPPDQRGGRPPCRDRRGFEGILGLLWTGAPRSALPERYGAKSAVHRRLSAWAESGVLLNAWRAFLDQRKDARQIRGNECCVDGLCVPANKGAGVWARPHAARGRR
jgi:transposase